MATRFASRLGDLPLEERDARALVRVRVRVRARGRGRGRVRGRDRAGVRGWVGVRGRVRV
mgnify:FL=1|jgi:hypothetical protein